MFKVSLFNPKPSSLYNCVFMREGGRGREGERERGRDGASEREREGWKEGGRVIGNI